VRPRPPNSTGRCRDARLDGAVRVVVAAELTVEIAHDEVAVVARPHPFVDIVLRVAVALETGRVAGGPQGEILAAEMGRRRPGRLLLDRIAVGAGNDIDAPAEIGEVRRIV